ncbi:MAG: nucleotidyltransferase domain-containing protein, partial [Candidatus Rokubacteria bacterium]|nr:nucleotidyltransferase domain-containing protein [Candidatus Rokubacteria bacterium]
MALEVFRQLKRADALLQRAFEGPPAQLAAERRRLRLALLRQHLDSGLDTLKARHAAGASGQESVRAYAGFMDRFLSRLFTLAVEDALREGLARSTIVLVALGGYGRGELHPSSDIDVMVIYDWEMSPYVQRITQD